MRFLIFTIFLYSQFTATSIAQKPIDGKWHIKTDFNLDGKIEEGTTLSECALNLKTTETGLLAGEYADCKRKTIIEAQLFNNEIITFLIQDPDGIIVCTGRWDGKNTIKGTYYQQGAGKEGDFLFLRELQPDLAARKREAATPTTATAAATPATATYIVKQGDTFYSIAKKYNLTFQQLLDLNNKKDSSLRVGEVLRVTP